MPGIADAPLMQASKYRVLDLEIGPDTAVTPVMAAQFSSGMTTPSQRPQAGMRQGQQIEKGSPGVNSSNFSALGMWQVRAVFSIIRKPKRLMHPARATQAPFRNFCNIASK
jgi:hypothetical protein